MKRLEVIFYIAIVVVLAALYKQHYIDEASVGLAIGLIGTVRGIVYQREKIKMLNNVIKTQTHQLELQDNHIKVLKARG